MIVYLLLLITVNLFSITSANNDLELHITISAYHRLVEISWNNAPLSVGDKIVITDVEPLSFHSLEKVQNDAFEYSGRQLFSDPVKMHRWAVNNGKDKILTQVSPKFNNGWFVSQLKYNYKESAKVTKETRCYAYWVTYLNVEGQILKTQCLRAEPTWMNEMKSFIGDLRMRDLFIPGTHDSGSYRPGFKPRWYESPITKYALTQDEDIRGQLYHGVRYLDIRPAYHKKSKTKFYVNHGITKQRPLMEVIEHVRDFIRDTNEIVIFGVKEFPVGFGKDLTIHRLLVNLLKEEFGELIIDPSLSWSVKLNDIWNRKQNIFLAYDKQEMVDEFPNVLIQSVQQRWGDVRNWKDLEKYLRGLAVYDKE